MKANPCIRSLAAIPLIVTLALAASCSEPRVTSSPVPAQTPSPSPTPTPPPTPPASTSTVDWRQAPITPGIWEWSMAGGQSIARFASGQLVLQCNKAGRTVTLLRSGIASGPVPMTILSTHETRPVTGQPVSGGVPALAVTLPADDSLLDAMAFSRGRFAVEASGLPTLYVPSWPEVSRVIEDCR